MADKIKLLFYFLTIPFILFAQSQDIKFEHLSVDQGLSQSIVHSILQDRQGYLWIGTEDGLNKYDGYKFIIYLHDQNNPSSLSHNNVRSLCEDRSGVLWIGSWGGGLNKFDREKEQFTHYQHDSENPTSLRDDYIVSICEDKSGDIWIGTSKALHKFDKETEQFIQIQFSPESSDKNSFVKIFEDRFGNLWIGTWNGLNKFDRQKEQFTHYRQIPGNPNSLSSNSVWVIYESSQSGENILWIGTKNGGLNRFNRNTGKYKHYFHDPYNPNSLSNNTIFTILESHFDAKNELWIGTYNGLNKLDLKTEQFTRYMHDPNNPHSISSDIIRSLYEDRDGFLWIGTHNGGLCRFNPEKEQFTQVDDSPQIMSIYEDQSGILWIGAFNGLKKFDHNMEQITHYTHDVNNPNSISNNQVLSVYEDKSGTLWIGTSCGLNKFNRETDQFFNFTENDGLPNNVINGILEDKHGNLWPSTNKGLSRFNPKTKTFRNYDVHDGLQSNEFHFQACSKSKDGEMFFGGINGFNAFYPDRIKDNPHIPQIVITDFQLFNKPVTVKKDNVAEKKNSYSLPKHISTLKEIELSYRENVFSFEFAALDYHSPQKNQYAYMMEGFEGDWNFTDYTRRFATYTNLDPGEYVFKVKGSNNDGIWNEEGISIKITITPPWWKTNLAYTFYVLLIGSIVFGVWRFQTNRLKMKHELELEHVHTEKLEEVDQLKSRFFANISHEFRTPLTLILGPIEQMISGKLKGNLVEHYKIIRRNGKRLLQLINQLLDLSKLESGKLKLQARATEIISLTNELVQAFESLAVRKKITLKFNSEIDSQEVYIDVDKFEKIINNLLSNAFKFTPEGGNIDVKMSLRGVHHKVDDVAIPQKIASLHSSARNDDNGYIKITITNTGPGITPDRLDKIFDRFYQVDDSVTRHQEGTGIGLALTKELVELHHGTIDVHCIKGTVHRAPTRGDLFCTTFTILLPIGKKHYSEDEIVVETSISKVDDQVSQTVSSIEYPVSSIQYRVSRNPSPISGLPANRRGLPYSSSSKTIRM